MRKLLPQFFCFLVAMLLYVCLSLDVASLAYADEPVSVSPNLSNTINGYAKVEREYDDAGNLILQRYLDSDLLPVVGPEDYAEVNRSYDSDRHLISEEYFGPNGEPFLQAGGYAAIGQTWENGTLTSRTYLDLAGQPLNRIDGYSKAIWKANETGTISVMFQDVTSEIVNPSGLNLVTDVKFGPDGWSQWMIPSPGAVNYCFSIGSTCLSEKQEGAFYTCQIEIEYKNVSATPDQEFHFWTQGSADQVWTIGNPWNASLVYLDAPPSDGIHQYTSTVQINDQIAAASTFDLGFRCDCWGSGMFRVRNVKIEIGDQATEWTPGI